jgi:arylformamidase
MTIFDITIPIHAGLAGWPGDEPYRMERTAALAAGETVNLSALHLSAHTGTHFDAPYHFLEEGAPVDQIPLEVCIGTAVVVDVSGRAVIRREDIPETVLHGAPRLLLRTGGWTDHARFPVTIPVLAGDVPAWLAERGVVLLGVDVPSVDALDSSDLPLHHALAAHDIHILEAVDLSGVPPGRYELTALPLRLVGADGAPARAVLREISP